MMFSSRSSFARACRVRANGKLLDQGRTLEEFERSRLDQQDLQIAFGLGASNLPSAGSTNLQGTSSDQHIDGPIHVDGFLGDDFEHPGYLQSYTSKIDHRGLEV